MESQPQNPEFRINPEKFHPWKLTCKELKITCDGMHKYGANIISKITNSRQ